MIDSLRLLLYDDNVLVQKKLIVSMITIYRLTLKVRNVFQGLKMVRQDLGDSDPKKIVLFFRFSGFLNLDLLMKMSVVCGRVWLI